VLPPSQHGARHAWPRERDDTLTTAPLPATLAWEPEYPEYPDYPDHDDRGLDDEAARWRARRRSAAPWATRPARASRPVRSARPEPVPVFVDDSGRRRRAGRMVGATLAVAVLTYLVVIGLSVAGVPYVGRLAPPGLDLLSRPSGDAGVVTGPAVDEVPLPAPPDPTAAAQPDRSADELTTASTPPTTVPSTATTAVPTSTTVTHGRSANQTDPTPSSTVPTTTPGGGRRPDTPPGQG
jgi:hypothetical protein